MFVTIVTLRPCLVKKLEMFVNSEIFMLMIGGKC